MILTWCAVLVYCALSIAVGWHSHRRHRDADTAFWTAGRQLGAFSVGLSISAGFMSVSWSCVYAVQLFYGYGLGALWLITIPWLLTLLGIGLLARRYHRLPAFSQPEMVESRFGRSARVTVAAPLAFVFLVWGGAEIYVAGSLLGPQLGISLDSAIVGISLIVAIYATLGGFRAVIDTDKLQFVIVAAYIIAIAVLAAYGLRREGLGLIPSSEWAAARTQTSWVQLGSPGLALIVLTLVAYLPGWLFETDLWVRVQAAKDERAARCGVAIAWVNAAIFVGVLPLFIGVASLALFPPSGGFIPRIVGQEGDAIFAALVGEYAPGWLAALVAVGLVAAAMSTIDTCAHVMALSIGYDLLRLDRRESGNRDSRWITALAIAACCLFALNTESLWDLFYLSGGVLTTAVAFPVAAVFLPRISKRRVILSSRAGFAGTILFYILESEGLLKGLEPEAVSASGLGYILWGILAAIAGFAIAGNRAPR